MGLNPVKVAQAVQSGLSTVCATCTRYWEGRDRGLPGDTCAARTPCGSPLAGDDFHEYVGPLSDFSRWCFICGEEPTCVIQRPGSSRLFGVCERHKQLLASLKPVNLAAASAGPLVRLADGGTHTLENLLPPRKPTLMERIAATEAEFEKRDREKGLLPEEP